jgi:3-oxoacyl-[acyl-carrier-protein] synthase II
VSDRLWVTGVGLTTALGVGVDETWGRLVRGDRAISPLTLFDATDQRVNLGAEVRRLPETPASLGTLSRTGAMAVAAATEALAMAKLTAARARVGLVVGSTTGGLFETEALLARLHAHPPSSEALDGLLAYPLSGSAAAIDEAVGPFARVRTISSACSSGANAIVAAASWLLAEDLDAVVAGGSDSLCRLTLSGFNALTALDPEPCRPFDRRRRGTSLGEGAGFLVIERRRDAVARGALGLAELSGWAAGADAYHVTNPEPTGQSMAGVIEQAMARASVEPADVDYVNAHGTGTLANDSAEALALARVLGEDVRRVPVSSCKGQLGHTLGAAGAIEAAVTALVVSRSILVPTGGLEQPDDTLGLVHVPQVGRAVARVRAAVSNAFGFGGMNAVLVFRRIDGEAEHAPAASTRRVAIVGGAVAGESGSRGVRDYASVVPPAAPSSSLGTDALDAVRSRRLDQTARRATVAALRALADAQAAPGPCGAILGTAFGTVDGTAAYMHRVFTKGTRYASPAEFPNLLPSTSAGHLSIYAGLNGPLFAEVDPRMSGEDAVVDAIRLVAAGVAPRMLAGSSDIRGGAVVEALARLFEPGAPPPADGNAAIVVLLEDVIETSRRKGDVLACVERVVEWRGPAREGLARVPAPCSSGAEVFVSRFEPELDEALGSSLWGACRRWPAAGALEPRVGLGTRAFLAAAARIRAGMASEALVVGVAPGGGHAVVLVASTARGGR